MHFSSLPQFPDALPATAGVLLKCQPLSQLRYAQTLVREARRYAREIVDEARTEADGCHENAARAGYEAGFMQALTVALNALRECRQMHLQLRERMETDARNALLGVLEDPRLVARLAKHLGARHTELEQARARVTLPRVAQRMASAVRKRVERIWPDAETVYSDTHAFIVEWGDQVIEFAPPRSAAQLSATAMAASDKAIAAIDEDALASSILEAALRELKPDTTGCTDPE